MRKTKYQADAQQILVDTIGLQKMLNSGRTTATAVGTAAGARVEIGKRVFWHVGKVQRYLDGIAV